MSCMLSCLSIESVDVVSFRQSTRHRFFYVPGEIPYLTPKGASMKARFSPCWCVGSDCLDLKNNWNLAIQLVTVTDTETKTPGLRFLNIGNAERTRASSATMTRLLRKG